MVLFPSEIRIQYSALDQTSGGLPDQTPPGVTEGVSETSHSQQQHWKGEFWRLQPATTWAILKNEH